MPLALSHGSGCNVRRTPQAFVHAVRTLVVSAAVAICVAQVALTAVQNWVTGAIDVDIPPRKSFQGCTERTPGTYMQQALFMSLNVRPLLCTAQARQAVESVPHVRSGSDVSQGFRFPLSSDMPLICTARRYPRQYTQPALV